ncbi:hypothetical protein WDU94_004264 [Cyamophila willieti]
MSYVELIVRDQLDPNVPRHCVMSHEDLVCEIITVISVGFDTTKTANAIILHMMAFHPKIQEDVFQEIKSVLGDDPNTPPTYNQLHDLHLLTRVIKETLRLFPSAPIMAREAEDEIQVDGYTVPKGTTMGVMIYGIHRDPQYWTDPNQFNPDRFLPSETARRNLNTYLPFSTGSRNCIGNKYAMLQMKTTVSTILRRYKILPGDKCKSMDDIRFEFGLTMRLLPGNDIRLAPRSNTRLSDLRMPA